MYSTIIKEKRAKEIISYIISDATKQDKLNQVTVLNLFYSKGEDIINTHLLELLDEVNKLNTAISIRLNYDDSLRLRDYFEQFIPQYKIDLLFNVVKELSEIKNIWNDENLKSRFWAVQKKASKAIDNYKKATLMRTNIRTVLDELVTLKGGEYIHNEYQENYKYSNSEGLIVYGYHPRPLTSNIPDQSKMKFEAIQLDIAAMPNYIYLHTTTVKCIPELFRRTAEIKDFNELLNLINKPK